MMNVTNYRAIDAFKNKYSDAKAAMDAWYAETEEVIWKTTQDIKNRYSSASFLKDNYVIFNIKGNSYRLVTKIAYNLGVVKIIWIGTHADYNKQKFP